MQDFIDLEGASGASYRFRIWASGVGHLPVAGNYVVVGKQADGFGVEVVGIADDLSKVRVEWSKVAAAQGAFIFTTSMCRVPSEQLSMMTLRRGILRRG